MKNNQKEIILLEDLGMLYPKETSKHKIRYGLYKCVCNSEFKAQVQDVKRKHTTSCGCLKNKSKITHNLTKHKIYNIWRNIKDRCTNIKHKSYNDYGGRGITVCDEWLDIESFIKDMFPSFQEGLSIDRIDNNKGYSKDNCRWTTNIIQARNKRKLISSNTSGYRGVSWSKQRKKWIVHIKTDKNNYLGLFNTAEEGALVYDKYVIDNNLEHTLNFNNKG